MHCQTMNIIFFLIDVFIAFSSVPAVDLSKVCSLTADDTEMMTTEVNLT